MNAITILATARSRTALVVALGLMATAACPAMGESLPMLQPAVGVWVGPEPTGPDDFAALAAMGVRTVVSVDGMPPDVETARRSGLRYVHAPMGYDRVGPQVTAVLTTLAHQEHAPLYVHCQHGKHRGPTAAVILCMAKGALAHADAERFLQQAGTNPRYTGLWSAVRTFEPLNSIETVELLPTAETRPLALAMAQVSRAWDRVDQGDPSPEAIELLRQGFVESLRATDPENTELYQSMREAKKLVTGQEDTWREKVGASCVACHTRWRD